MKSEEELSALQQEAVNEKPDELTGKELEQVSSGEEPATAYIKPPIWVTCPDCGKEFQTDRIPATCIYCGLIFYPYNSD